jgi:hypothetical protein
MPLEIRELVIKVTVDENIKKQADMSEKMEALKQEVIYQCYEKIINKLETYFER